VLTENKVSHARDARLFTRLLQQSWGLLNQQVRH
jgi:hypothetical protein